jgi:hypothetical protein
MTRVGSQRHSKKKKTLFHIFTPSHNVLTVTTKDLRSYRAEPISADSFKLKAKKLIFITVKTDYVKRLFKRRLM